MQLSAKERITRAARGQEVDRIPSLGGWMNGVRNLAALAGITVEQYLTDPRAGVIRANRALDVDGMVDPAVPKSLDEVRTGVVEEQRFAGVEPEALLEDAEKLPDSENQVLAGFAAAATEQWYRDYFNSAQRDWQGIVAVPNFWDLGGPFSLYQDYGYTAFLTACALYPEAVRKIWWSRAVVAAQRSRILVRLYRELDLAPLLFCGEDLCNNQGPMVSPQFLRENYLPLVGMIIEPLVDAGVRVVHHCDGDVRPLIDDFLDIGFSGFQGFQYECGVDICDLRTRRSRLGEEIILFTGMSVSRTLPFGTASDIRDEIDFFVQATDGGRGMFLFTSNVTGVEVPAENIRTAYRYVKEIEPGRRSSGQAPGWPWLRIHRE